MTEALTKPPRREFQTFWDFPLATDLDKLEADIAILGLPYGAADSIAEVSNDQTNALTAIRRLCERALRGLDRWDFDIGGTLLAALARARCGARFFGGVVLSAYADGLNPKAVEGAVSGNRAQVDDPARDPSSSVVWMPTVNAKTHLDHHGFGFDPNWAGCCDHGHATKPAAEADPIAMFSSNGRRALILES
jgi:hypothetical protein